MKVYIILVGERDPHWKEEDGRIIKFNDLPANYSLEDVKEGPVLSFLRLVELKNSYIYLIPTTERPSVSGTIKGSNKTNELIEKIFKGDNCKVFVRPINVENPTDHRDLYPKIREIVESIKEDVKKSDPEYLVNIQPGTPQMGHIFIGLSILGVIGARFVERTRENTIKETHISFIAEDGILKKGKTLIKEGYFGSAGLSFIELKDATVLSENKRKAEIFASLADLYEKWDILHYQEVYQRIDSLLREKDISTYSIYENLRQILTTQRKVLERLKNEDKDSYIIDIYYNAKRRLEQGNFPDALWRLISIYEVIIRRKASDEIKNKNNISSDPDNFASSIASFRNKLTNMLKNVFGVGNISNNTEFYKKVPESLKIEQGEAILRLLNIQFYNTSRTLSSPIKKVRNNLLHKMKFPTQPEVEKGIESIKKIITDAGISFPEDYCFSNDYLEKISDIIQDIYLTVI